MDVAIGEVNAAGEQAGTPARAVLVLAQRRRVDVLGDPSADRLADLAHPLEAVRHGFVPANVTPANSSRERDGVASPEQRITGDFAARLFPIRLSPSARQ